MSEVKFNEAGIGLGATAGHNSEHGARTNAHAEFSSAAFIEHKSGADPLLIWEGDAQWNVIGIGPEGDYTGVQGRLQLALGGQFKGSGRNDSGLYVTGTGTFEGGYYYDSPLSTQVRASIGSETGYMVQSGRTIYMLSPTVQLGRMQHFQIDDTLGPITDLLQYGLRGRVILNNKMFLSAEVLYNPNTADTSNALRDPGSGWDALQVNSTVRYKIDDDSLIHGSFGLVDYSGRAPRNNDRMQERYEETSLATGGMLDITGAVTYVSSF